MNEGGCRKFLAVVALLISVSISSCHSGNQNIETRNEQPQVSVEREISDFYRWCEESRIDPDEITVGEYLDIGDRRFSKENPVGDGVEWNEYRNGEFDFALSYPSEVVGRAGERKAVSFKVYSVDELRSPRNIVFSSVLAGGGLRAYFRIERKPEDFISLEKYVKDFVQSEKERAKSRGMNKRYIIKKTELGRLKGVTRIAVGRYTSVATFFERDDLIHIITYTYDTPYLIDPKKFAEMENFDVGDYVKLSFRDEVYRYNVEQGIINNFAFTAR